MNKKYKIYWYCKNTPEKINIGTGTVSYTAAVAWIKYLNTQYPELHHYFEEVAE